MDCDRILVMEKVRRNRFILITIIFLFNQKGKVAEFDTPDNLLKSRTSLFAKLVAAGNDKLYNTEKLQNKTL
jgi:hypothetical protein